MLPGGELPHSRSKCGENGGDGRQRHAGLISRKDAKLAKATGDLGEN
jgi:hypothetical protein